MQRRDLAWITDSTGRLVAVTVVRVDPVSCRLDYETDVEIPAGGELHVPGVTHPALTAA
jgi:hypothetical protein